ncbi:transcriptional regulator [uncultured Mediterranean phage]|nr:transcriptional regulator [uncultured Mediterranean phage]
MKTTVHVSPRKIRYNQKHGTRHAVLTIRVGDEETIFANEVQIHGPSRIVYSPDKPLPSSGARVCLETYAKVEVVDDPES